MNRGDLLAYCLSKAGATEEYPFDADTAVIKVHGKMFALVPMDILVGEAPQISLKCDPALAEVLRQTYDAVKPGYHLNKRHWNTITVDGSVPDDEVCEMIDNSYTLVAKGLPKKLRDTLAKHQPGGTSES